MQKQVAILITAHNRRQKTVKCINNIYLSSIKGVRLSVYLCDDNSTDGTTEYVKRLFPQVNVIKGDGNLFWNRGMHLAWENACKANPDYYLWLNDDTQIMSDSICRLLKCSNELSDKAIVVGSTYASQQRNTLTYGGRLRGRNKPFVVPDEYTPTPCDTFNGNIVLIPRYVFEIVGFNDDYYHHSFGDFDYGIVAWLKGVRSYVAPGHYGLCERNNPIPLFRRNCYSLMKRYKLLYSPLGYNPMEDFHLNKKYLPLWKCIWYFIKLHINVLFAVDHTKYE